MDCVSRAWQYQSNFKKMLTKLEKRAEQVLPGSKGLWLGEGEGGGKGEKWPKQCMHI
jgi:hypothetical protein